MYIPDRGDLITFDYYKEKEIEHFKKAIVLSPKKYNKKTEFVLLCPITKDIKNNPFEIILYSLMPDEFLEKSVIITDQIQSIKWTSKEMIYEATVSHEIVSECIDKISSFMKME